MLIFNSKMSKSTVIDDSTRLYTRNSSSKQNLLKNKLLKNYTQNIPDYLLSGFQCRIFPSGMNAIYTLMHCIAIKEENPLFVIGSELYCDTPKIVKLIKTYVPNLKCISVNVTDSSKIVELFENNKNKIKLFFIESCTNPSGKIFDFSLIQNLRKTQQNIVVAVDNTWLSSVIFNPLDYDVDVVIESMTKYISASTRIGGMLITNNLIINDISDYMRLAGVNYCPQTCEVINNNLTTLRERILKVSYLTKQLVNYLVQTSEKSNITKIFNPSLQNSDSNHMALKYFNKHNEDILYPGCIFFHIATKNKHIKTILKEISKKDIIKLETSYGAPYSKICNYFKYGNSDKYDNLQINNPIEGVWLRLSIGFDSDFDNIVQGLNFIFDNAKK